MAIDFLHENKASGGILGSDVGEFSWLDAISSRNAKRLVYSGWGTDTNGAKGPRSLSENRPLRIVRLNELLRSPLKRLLAMNRLKSRTELVIIIELVTDVNKRRNFLTKFVVFWIAFSTFSSFSISLSP